MIKTNQSVLKVGKNYSLVDEHVVDIASNVENEFLKGVKNVYSDFAKEYYEILNLRNTDSVKYVFEQAQKHGVLSLAKKARNTVFGDRMFFYGVTYVDDFCVEGCSYCPMSVFARDAARKKGDFYKRRTLDIANGDFAKDIEAIQKDGHTQICVLAGNPHKKEDNAHNLLPYLKELDKIEGVHEIILNVDPFDKDGFTMVRDAVTQTLLQFRVFQETYNWSDYEKLHPKTKFGHKRDYDYRYESQSMALDAGFDNVGLGWLGGLSQNPFFEINATIKHASELYSKYGKYPIRLCLPVANYLETIETSIPFVLNKGKYDDNMNLLEYGHHEMASELIYALTRLAMPEMNIVSSERDLPGLLNILDQYATCTTLNVHPGVGENAKVYDNKDTQKTVHFEQASTFARNASETLMKYKERGYDPTFIIKE